MQSFVQKLTDWILEKEEEAAKKCYISQDDIEAQIKKTQAKRDELAKKCQDELSTIDGLIERLEKIKTESCKKD